MMTDGQRLRWIASGVGLLLVAVGVTLWLGADTPWPLIAGASAIVVLALAQYASGTFAIAVASVLLVLVAVVSVRASPLTGGSIEHVAMWCLVAIGLAASVVIAAPPRHRTNPPAFARAIAATVTPGIAVLTLLVAEQLGSRGVVWAMHGDAVWNLVTARFMLDDGGMRPELHPNSSPAAAALLAVVASVGRDVVVPADLLRHDVDRLAQLWIVFALLASVMAALVAVHTPKLTRVGRWVAGIVAGLVPLSWYVMGFSWELGFLNAPIALVLLLASWIAWLECRISPLRGAALLSVTAVALLATWAPLAAVPSAFAVAALIADRRRLRRSLGAVAAWVAVALPVPLYVLVVTLDDFRRDGAALAVNGGFPALGFGDTVVTTGVAVTIIGLVALNAGDRHRLIGVAALVVAGAVGVGYLVAQRMPTGVPWGYYPAKMAWLVLVLLIVIAVGSVCAIVPVDRSVRLRSVALAATGAVALAGCMVLVPPLRQPVIANLIPWVDVARGTGVAAPAESAEALFAVARPGVKSVAARYSGDDGFLNLWLLQLESESSAEPVRAYAFGLDVNDPNQVCGVIRAWGGQVVVHTRDPGLSGELEAVCGDLSWEVDSRG